MNHREIKRRARRQLHNRLADTVLYLTSKNDLSPTGLKVRLHIKFAEVGELLRGGFAERQEQTPQAVFMEFNPVNDAFIVTKDMGTWRVDNTMPPDDITVTAEIARLTKSQIQSLGWDPDAPWLGFPEPVLP